MSVYGVDGSKYTLPATDKIREKFDPDSGLENKGKGHYPKCLVSTLYDVFRRIPIARTVVGIPEANERNEAKNLVPSIPDPAKSICLFDRGYPSFELINYLINDFLGYFIFRCPASNTFPAVAAFINKGSKEGVIWITPSNKYLSSIPVKDRKHSKKIKLRIVRLISPDGTVSFLLTNLHNKKEFRRKEIIDLYFRRWEVEGYYRDEKIVMEIETFHTKTVNGILQELYAAMIMSVISRTLMALSSENVFSGEREFQFKNSIMALASDAAVLVASDPVKAIEIFEELLLEISRVKYYRPKEPRSSQPRVTKKVRKKWKSNNSKNYA